MTSRQTLPDLLAVSKLWLHLFYAIFNRFERYVQFIDIWVKYAINETYAWTFVRILVW
jgi:hypothetical protein